MAHIPIVGVKAGAKARRVGEELFARCDDLLRGTQRPPFLRKRCDVIGGEGTGVTTAYCRLVADHSDQAGAALMAREQVSAISHMSVGITLGPPPVVRPLQWIAAFGVPRSAVALTVTVDGQPVPHTAASDGVALAAPSPPMPVLPADADPALTVPLVRLAWARSGDKGNLFNVAVIAREAEYLPYIAAALGPDAVGAHYGRMLESGGPLPVEVFSAPGLQALNFVVGNSLEGGILACTRIDPVAKGMAQMVLEWPVPVSAELFEKL